MGIIDCVFEEFARPTGGKVKRERSKRMENLRAGHQHTTETVVVVTIAGIIVETIEDRQPCAKQFQDEPRETPKPKAFARSITLNSDTIPICIDG